MTRIASVARTWSVVLLGVAAISCAVRPNSALVESVSEAEETPDAKAEPEVIFAQILEKHRISVEEFRSPGRCHSDHPSHSMNEFQFHLTEARLWAISFPREAELVSFPLALDATSNPDDRDLAIYVVGVLARMGNPKAEPLLCELIRSSAERAAAAATGELAQGDPKGRYRELYWQRAQSTDFYVLEVLGDWADPGTRRILEDIVARGSGGAKQMASRSLERLAWLESPDWAVRISSILESKVGMTFRDFDWALRVARNRSLPGLAELLRKRLREGESEFAERCKQIWGDAYGTAVNQASERDFAGSFLVTWVDWNFDDVLIAYAECGGALTDPEQQRLYSLGYGNHPRKRLFELVKDWEKRP